MKNVNITEKELRKTVSIPFPYPVDMPDYVIMFGDWYACYPDGHRRYICPTGEKKTRKHKT